MRIAIRPEWSFIEAVDAAWDAYRGGREHGVPNRIRVLEQWANVVGRERAQREFEQAISTYSDLEAASKDLGFSIYALKKLRRSFAEMPEITPYSAAATSDDHDNSNYDFFISYSSKDRRFVLRLAEDLKRRGLEVWLDLWEMRPGDRLRDRIAEGITRCDRLLVLLSPHSINSSWVKIELDSAMIRELESNSVVVVPTLYGEISVEDIPLDLKGKLYLDFRKKSNYSRNLESILKLVRKQTSKTA
jgi:hypothetical protein